jgi:hypothetical protein
MFFHRVCVASLRGTKSLLMLPMVIPQMAPLNGKFTLKMTSTATAMQLPPSHFLEDAALQLGQRLAQQGAR